MSDKHANLEPLKPGDFQLDPHGVDVRNMIGNGLIKAAAEYFNNADFNHDGKRDLVQYGPAVLKTIQLVTLLAPHIHPEKAKEYLLNLPIFHDPEAAKALILKGMEEVAALVPPVPAV